MGDDHDDLRLRLDEGDERRERRSREPPPLRLWRQAIPDLDDAGDGRAVAPDAAHCEAGRPLDDLERREAPIHRHGPTGRLDITGRRIPGRPGVATAVTRQDGVGLLVGLAVLAGGPLARAGAAVATDALGSGAARLGQL